MFGYPVECRWLKLKYTEVTSKYMGATLFIYISSEGKPTLKIKTIQWNAKRWSVCILQQCSDMRIGSLGEIKGSKCRVTDLMLTI